MLYHVWLELKVPVTLWVIRPDLGLYLCFFTTTDGWSRDHARLKHENITEHNYNSFNWLKPQYIYQFLHKNSKVFPTQMQFLFFVTEWPDFWMTPVEKILKLSKTLDNSSKDHWNPTDIENYAKTIEKTPKQPGNIITNAFFQ